MEITWDRRNEMSTHKCMDKICIAAILLALIVTVIFMNGKNIGIVSATKTSAYEDRLFDNSRVHNIDIVMQDWDKFIKSCTDKKYSPCTVVIDGKKYGNVGIRAKGSSSLEGVTESGSSRYSFKIKFNKYEKATNYYGLDKLSLNNIIYDNTYMMDYLTYQMMRDFGVSSPLCSYTTITVNGKKWGFYLAVEGLEKSFLKRNYGSNYGNLYKPESSAVGVADEENMENEDKSDESSFADANLQYIDENPESYSLFFNNAKTKIKSKDKKRFISSIKDLNNGTNLESVIDVEKVIRYFVVHNFVVNGDSYTGESAHNYYLYEKGGKLTMIPWDYNMSFGTYDVGDSTTAVNTPINNALNNRPMQSWIFQNEKYTKMYHKYYNEFLNSTDITKRIEDTKKLIESYVEEDPSKFCTYEEFQKAVRVLNSFCDLRVKSIQGQLNGTVPSTSEGQKLDRTALIDASGINISDMQDKKIPGGGGAGDNESNTVVGK